jgi:hypothetical protein
MKKSLVLLMLVSTMLLSCSLITSTATPTPVVPVPEAILSEVLQSFEDCRQVAGIDTQDDTSSFSCSTSADSIYTIAMMRYASDAAASAQFESGRGDNPISCFHGYDLYETVSPSSDNEPSRINHQGLYWQAGQWVIAIYASYDYGFYHIQTIDFAEAVYSSAIGHDLFQAGECPNTGTTSP